MSLSLSQWKLKAFEEARAAAKKAMHEGGEVMNHTVLTAEDVAEIAEEVAVEQFSEDVNLEEVEFHDVDESAEFCVEYFDFVTEEFNEEWDVEFEIAEEVMQSPKLAGILGEMKRILFAEDYKVVVSEDGNRAKVVFSRAKGKVSKKKKCPPGKSLKGNRCVAQTGSQKAQNRRASIKIKRAKKKVGAGAKKRAALQSKITKKRVKGRARNYSGT